MEDFFLRRAWISEACGTVYSNVLTVNVLPVYHDTVTAVICQGEAYHEQGFDLTATQTAVPGIHYYTMNYLSNSCDSTVTLKLMVNQVPVLIVSNEVTVDEGDSVLLQASGAYQYFWSPSENIIDTNVQNPLVYPSHSMYYYVIGYGESVESGVSSCYSIDSVLVMMRRHMDTTVCEGSLPIDYYGIQLEDTLPYTITVSFPNGLDEMYVIQAHLVPNTYSSVDMMVTEQELPVTFLNTDFNDAADTVFVIANAAGCDSLIHFTLRICENSELNMAVAVCEEDMPYLWQGQVLTQEGDYSVVLQNECGADSVVNLQLSVTSITVEIVPLTDDFCEMYLAELSVETNVTDYEWNTGEASPVITVTEPGVYSVTATQDHCSVSASYQIETCDLNVYLPNAITPGVRDGLNDYFCLHDEYKPMIESFEIRIYSRWGEMVYYSNSKDFKWNGEYRGNINRNIIYTYIINFTDKRGIPHQLTGSITVL